MEDKLPISRENNFDFLRLLFALFVIYTHSFPLTGLEECDILCQLTGSGGISYYGVRGFFIISGFLIYKSFLRSSNFFDYFKKRALRLFPALIVVLLLTILLGYFITSDKAEYFLKEDTFTYFFRNLSLYNLQWNIKGIFENNPYPNTINGSLWTIRYEFTLYLLVAILFIFKKKETVMKIIVLTSTSILLILSTFFQDKVADYGLFYQMDVIFLI